MMRKSFILGQQSYRQRLRHSYILVCMVLILLFVLCSGMFLRKTSEEKYHDYVKNVVDLVQSGVDAQMTAMYEDSMHVRDDSRLYTSYVSASSSMRQSRDAFNRNVSSGELIRNCFLYYDSPKISLPL